MGHVHLYNCIDIANVHAPMFHKPKQVLCLICSLVDTTTCLTITPPRNGAVVCDTWLGGEFCQAQCRNGTTMSSVDLGTLYVCSKNGNWIPSPSLNTACQRMLFT